VTEPNCVLSVDFRNGKACLHVFWAATFQSAPSCTTTIPVLLSNVLLADKTITLKCMNARCTALLTRNLIRCRSKLPNRPTLPLTGS
jgi:hypothetical protein